MYPRGSAGQTPILEVAEAARIAEGIKLLQARKAKEIAEAKVASQEREKTMLFQAKLQAKLQELATNHAASYQTFAAHREKMMKESQAVVLHLKALQSSHASNEGAPTDTNHAQRDPLPPHLSTIHTTTRY
jgi:hypothetical protein